MDWTVFTVVISVAAALSGIVLGWTGRGREARKEFRNEAAAGAVLQVDVEYIKRGIDDIRIEQKTQGQRVDILSDRVARVEESTKSAHKRIDRLDGQPAGEMRHD